MPEIKSSAGPKALSQWSLYLVRTASGSLYCGITTDTERRFAEHCASGAKCARALRGRGPLQLVFQQPVGDKSMALKLEYRVKQLSKIQKERLVRGERSLPDSD
ncbi:MULTISPECIES: GIY-YIG nuclease family protein [unclassified Thalassolituus]|uniref:GIY-YIG nuclease family protein n=1 Tax=unclassified Thalassolituus TaxID=2624967 RepID=UPI0025F73C71|nr:MULTISPECIES: GIY-YIG nuclease family protein [unclassified Thalassolituus]